MATFAQHYLYLAVIFVRILKNSQFSLKRPRLDIRPRSFVSALLFDKHSKSKQKEERNGKTKPTRNVSLYWLYVTSKNRCFGDRFYHLPADNWHTCTCLRSTTWNLRCFAFVSILIFLLELSLISSEEKSASLSEITRSSEVRFSSRWLIRHSI